MTPSPEAVAEAASALRSGLLVGMPTETVYGIAADATNLSAVQATFRLKRRPPENPLIVHIAAWAWVSRVAREAPPAAERLASRFWPGPLTLVLRKRPELPSEVTAGLDTVAVRVPSHPVALALIEAADSPISAPSANVFGAISPTRADSIEPAIAESLAVILDGGPCQVGIESTVLDMTVEPNLILRQGVIGADKLREALGREVLVAEDAGPRRSPGMYRRHYAPRARLKLVDRIGDSPGLTFRPAQGKFQIQMPGQPLAYAAHLYEALTALDRMGLQEIAVEMPPDEPGWEAVRDRLTRAAAD